VAKKSSTKSSASKKAGHSAAKSAKPAKPAAGKGNAKIVKATAGPARSAKVAKTNKALPVKPPVKTPGKSLPPAAVVKAAKGAKVPVAPAKPAIPGKPQLVQGSILTHGLAAKNGKASSKRLPAFDPAPVRSTSKMPLLKAPKPPPAAVNRPVPVPVMSGGKAKKNQAGLSTKELDYYRDLLLAKRRELVGDMGSMEAEALRSSSGSNLSTLPMHMADMGTDNYEQEFTLGLVEKDRVVLREINQALAKIQDGTYGICEGTGKPIGKPRLEAQPWAKYSIEYARMLEKRIIR
jgi:DnaK suppressor protein